MKKANTPVPWWQPPFLNNPDRAIDAATREFLARHRDYYQGTLLEYLTLRVPVIRAQFARAHSHRGSTAA